MLEQIQLVPLDYTHANNYCVSFLSVAPEGSELQTFEKGFSEE